MPQWTQPQKQAIETPGNLIVSAAAGAGKTAVLTERLTRIVASGTPVDRLLVLTFTRAAAAEMKQRMEKKLRQAAAAEQDGERQAYLSREAGAVGRAYISTIDAFCARVLRRHGHLLDLPPSMRVLDDLEAPVLMERVKDALLTDFGAQNDENWRVLLQSFGSEDAAWAAVNDVFLFLQSQPDPRGWLELAVRRYEEPDWRRSLLTSVTVEAQLELKEALAGLRAARDAMPPCWAGTIGTLDEDLLYLNGALVQKTYDGYRASLLAYAPGRLGFPRGTAEEEKAETKAAREAVKKCVAAQCEQFFRTADEEEALLRRTGRVLAALEAVVTAFTALFDGEKRRMGALDYADLEHMTLELLKNEAVAAEYRERFLHIAVDEYQDSNRVQEALLQAIRREDNLFFVGDVKQSIYRFRQAEPSLFLEKLTAFDGTEGSRIDLTSNFRSAPAVLEAVNDVFSAILTRETGELDYDARARLVPGRAELSGAAELHLIERRMADGTQAPAPEEAAEQAAEEAAEWEEALDAEVEARLVVQRIRSLMQSETIPDRETGRPRALRYGDFAILLRTATEAGHMAATLAQAGIPCYAQMSGGYFDSVEVMLALNCLRVIDNRRQDIPLLSVLRAVAIAERPFSAEELAHIRMQTPEGGFFDAFEQAAGRDDALGRRAAAFLDRLEYWRQESLLQPVDRLLARLLDETGLYAQMGACTGGAQRQANLDALLFRARVFGQGAERGVGAFVRFMDRAGQSSARLGAAQQVSADVVRVLTIHRSKGLEFPIVFLCQLGRRFNMDDQRRNLVLHGTAGIGLRWIDGGVLRDTAARRAIVRRQRREQLAEEMRVLYVGMTRAEHRLILVGSWRNAAGLIEQAAVRPVPAQVLSVRAPLGWVLMGTRAHCPMALHRREEFLSASEDAPREALPDIPDEGTPENGRLLMQRLSWRYPFAGAAALPAKAAVSAVVRARISKPAPGAGADALTDERAWMGEPMDAAASADGRVWMGEPMSAAASADGRVWTEDSMDAAASADGRAWMGEPMDTGFELPAFVRDAERQTGPAGGEWPLTAAERGTAVHAVLASLPSVSLTAEQVRAHCDGLVRAGALTERQAEAVPAGSISEITQSALWARMGASARCERELPFSYLVPAAALYGADAADEKVLLQGVIDCCFVTGDGWVLLDYKTDRLRAGVSLASMAAEHLPQLELYAEALYRLTGLPVKERYVVLISAGRAVRV